MSLCVVASLSLSLSLFDHAIPCSWQVSWAIEARRRHDVIELLVLLMLMFILLTLLLRLVLLMRKMLMLMLSLVLLTDGHSSSF